MRYRAGFVFLILASAAACATATDSPTAPPMAAVVLPGSPEEPPPPPLDTQAVELAGESSGGFLFSLASARYFTNQPGTIAWLDFSSNDRGTTATPNARLLFNRQTGRVLGTGSLTQGDVTLDLSQLTLAESAFGACDGSVKIPTADPRTSDKPPTGPTCGYALFGDGTMLVVAKRLRAP